jgi:hypothetical protein
MKILNAKFGVRDGRCEAYPRSNTKGHEKATQDEEWAEGGVMLWGDKKRREMVLRRGDLFVMRMAARFLNIPRL